MKNRYLFTAPYRRSHTARNRQFALRPIVAALAALGGVQYVGAQQLPGTFKEIHGSAKAEIGDSSMTVINTPNAILEWGAFSIGPKSSVHFQQDNAASQVLNRVVGKDPSEILGTLTSNGKVWLVNPNGVLFGQGAKIEVAGLVASTLDISNKDFLANRFNFAAAGDSMPGEVVNKGQIRTSFGGRVWLLGNHVRNEDLIEADGGQIVLAAGKSIELVDSGVPNIVVRVTAPEKEALKLGTLSAINDSVDVYSGIVNQQGVVRATEVGFDANGAIALKATKQATSPLNRQVADAKTLDGTLVQTGSVLAKGGHINLNAQKLTYLAGTVDVSNNAGKGGSIKVATEHHWGASEGVLRADGKDGGSIRIDGTGVVGSAATLWAAGKYAGGSVKVTGDSVLLIQGKVDVTGSEQGGEVMLGSTQRPGDPPSARVIIVAPKSEIMADGAKGGHIDVRSTRASVNLGSLRARGAGSIELSSQEQVLAAGKMQAGAGGGVLIKSNNILVKQPAKEYWEILQDLLPFGGNTDGKVASHGIPSSTSYVAPNSIVSALSDGSAVTLQGQNDVRVQSPVVFTEGGRGGDFTLQAGRNIALSANVSTDNGNFIAVAGDPATSVSSKLASAPSVTIEKSATINVGRGTATLAAVNGSFINQNGDNAIVTRKDEGGRWLIFAANPSTTNEGFTSYNKRYNQKFVRGSVPGDASNGGNWFFYGVAPTLYVSPDHRRITYGDAAPDFTPTLNGFIDNDSLDAAGVYGRAKWTISGPLSTSGNPVAGNHEISYESGLLSQLGYKFADESRSQDELSIVQKTLTAKAHKIYDGKLNAPLEFDGVLSRDRVDTSPILGQFADKNAGTNKKVTLSGRPSGDDAGNYVLAPSVSGAEISKRGLTVSYDRISKVYDGTVKAEVHWRSSDVVADDAISVEQGARYEDKNAGKDKTVYVENIKLSPDSEKNYYLKNDKNEATTTGDILRKPLTTSGYTALDKVYDGTVNATLKQGTIDGVIEGDSVQSTITAKFDDKNAGAGKRVTIQHVLNGKDSGNYSPGEGSATTADITKRPITLNNYMGSKVYDGTVAAPVMAQPQNIVEGDNVQVSLKANFHDKNVGLGKKLTVTEAGLGGTDRGNYELPKLSTDTLTADITARDLRVTYTGEGKTYDQTTIATVKGSSDDIVKGDLLTFTQNAAFKDKNAGVDKTIDVTNIDIVGADSSNYKRPIRQATTKATIRPRTVSVEYKGKNKVYDAKTEAKVEGRSNDIIKGDNIEFVQEAHFENKNVGVGKTINIRKIELEGNDRDNYKLDKTTSTAKADITARELSVTYAGDTKDYDGSRSAPVRLGPLGAIEGDSITLKLEAEFADKNAGNGKVITTKSMHLEGIDKDNYVLRDRAMNPTGNITPKALDLVNFSGINKVYDTTANAEVRHGTPIGVIPGDVVGFAGASGAFDSADVGTNKFVTVSGGALTGVDAGNYVIRSRQNTKADIVPAKLTYVATPVAGVSQVLLPDLRGDIVGFKGNDNLSNSTTGTLEWSTPASGETPAGSYPVSGGGLSAHNYVFEQAPSNSSALTLIAPVTVQKGPQVSVPALEAGARAADPVDPRNEPRRESAIATFVPDPRRVSDLSGAADFGEIDLSSMSREEVRQLLESRREFKKKVLAEAVHKLEKDPNLAEAPDCRNASDAAAGACRLTDAQLQELAAKAGQIAQSRRKVRVATLPQIERKVAVLFGISQYDNPRLKLSSPVRDVEAVAKQLEEQMGYEVQIVRNPKKTEIFRVLSQLALEMRKGDSVIVYYAGHGHMIEKTGIGYWLPGDASATDPSNWISNKDVSRLLSSIPAKQVAMISDSCYSGTFTKEQSVRVASGVKAADVLSKRSVVTMSSGGEEPVADGGRRGHSVFAVNLMQSLASVSKWQPGSNVFQAVQREVTKSKFPQTPQYGASTSAGHQTGGDYLFETRQLEEIRTQGVLRSSLN